jgi:hypothetical protein
MSRSIKVLTFVALFAGLFEAVSVFFIDVPLPAALFSAVFLGGAWALAVRQSLVAVWVLGLFLLVDVAGVPFYAKSGWQDWVIQLSFGALGLVGLVACVDVLRQRRLVRRTA